MVCIVLIHEGMANSTLTYCSRSRSRIAHVLLIYQGLLTTAVTRSRIAHVLLIYQGLLTKAVTRSRIAHVLLIY